MDEDFSTPLETSYLDDCGDSTGPSEINECTDFGDVDDNQIPETEQFVSSEEELYINDILETDQEVYAAPLEISMPEETSAAEIDKIIDESWTDEPEPDGHIEKVLTPPWQSDTVWIPNNEDAAEVTETDEFDDLLETMSLDELKDFRDELTGEVSEQAIDESSETLQNPGETLEILGDAEAVPETPQDTETDSVDAMEQPETDSVDAMEQPETERGFDDYELCVIEENPDFYDTGSFYLQGINEYGYEGTCGPTSQANAINKLLDSNEMTENNILSIAVENDLCRTDGNAEDCGGTSTEEFMDLYSKVNEEIGGKINTELFEFANAPDIEEVARKLDEGCVLNVAVDAAALWGQERDYQNALNLYSKDFFSDHWITVTNAHRDDSGNISGFDIIDSGGGEDYVSADKYNEICFGTDEHRVIDPTAIVLSKADLPGDPTGATMQEIPENKPSIIQRIFGKWGSDS